MCVCESIVVSVEFRDLDLNVKYTKEKYEEN